MWQNIFNVFYPQDITERRFGRLPDRTCHKRHAFKLLPSSMASPSRCCVFISPASYSLIAQDEILFHLVQMLPGLLQDEHVKYLLCVQTKHQQRHTPRSRAVYTFTLVNLQDVMIKRPACRHISRKFSGSISHRAWEE